MHFEIFAVGVRCVLLPFSREANSYFEEEMASTFGEEKLTSISVNGLYQFLCTLLNSQAMIPGPSPTTCA